VLKPGGVLHLILPKKEECFDRHRAVGRLEDLLHRFARGAREEDMRWARVDETLLQSDLTADPGLLSQAAAVGSAAPTDFFLGRSMDNAAQRGLHQVVWDVALLENAMRVLRLRVLFTGVDGLNQHVLAEKEELVPQAAPAL